MYNVSKGPSKIVTQTRRGIAQSLETRRENSKKASGDNEVISVPKPVFHSNGNHKKYNSNRVIHDIITPQHEEIIRFINDSWNSVYSQYEQHSRTGTPSTISNDSSHSGENNYNAPVTSSEYPPMRTKRYFFTSNNRKNVRNMKPNHSVTNNNNNYYKNYHQNHQNYQQNHHLHHHHQHQNCQHHYQQQQHHHHRQHQHKFIEEYATPVLYYNPNMH